MDKIPWQSKLHPARLMDTHSVALIGGPDDPCIRHLIELIKKNGDDGLGWPARLLFALRDSLGKLLAWDSEKTKAKISSQSYFWHMTEDERAQCVEEPGQSEGPALILWNDEHSICVEVLNATCQAFAVGYIQNRTAHLSVFVIETKWWSKYYLALIEPFRKYIVYPALVRWLDRTWRMRA